EGLGQPRGEGQGCGPSGPVAQIGGHRGAVCRIDARLRPGGGELVQRRDERLGDGAPPVSTEPPGLLARAAHRSSTARTAATNARTRAGSFTPGRDSTPEATSTPEGRARRIASPTFAGVRPPASQKGSPKRRASCARDQSKVRPDPPKSST